MPEWKTEIKKRLTGLHLEPERESEILDEFSSHLQDRYDDLRASGTAREDALRDVISELDSTDLVSELQTTEETPSQPAPGSFCLRNNRMPWRFPLLTADGRALDKLSLPRAKSAGARRAQFRRRRSLVRCRRRTRRKPLLRPPKDLFSVACAFFDGSASGVAVIVTVAGFGTLEGALYVAEFAEVPTPVDGCVNTVSTPHPEPLHPLPESDHVSACEGFDPVTGCSAAVIGANPDTGTLVSAVSCSVK